MRSAFFLSVFLSVRLAPRREIEIKVLGWVGWLVGLVPSCCQLQNTNPRLKGTFIVIVHTDRKIQKKKETFKLRNR
jgi:hypothetical protein